jgi:hypothetical protein
MGRLTAGLLGPVIGKVGTVIGSSRNGIPYLKGPYKNRTRVISQKETLNRRKFAAAQVWLKPLLSFVRVGFKGYGERSEGFVSAKSYLLKNVLKVVDNTIIIDPALKAADMKYQRLLLYQSQSIPPIAIGYLFPIPYSLFPTTLLLQYLSYECSCFF